MALTTGILGYWKLEGNSNDATGNGNNGTDTTITYSSGNGKIGQGAGYNGTSSVISLGTGLNAAAGTGLTIAGWANMTANTAAIHEFFVKRDGTNGTEYQFGIINGTGNLFFFNGTSLNDSGSAAPMGSWTHFAITLDAVSSGTLTFYVNGSAVGSTFTTSLGSGTTANCYLGNQFPTNNEAINGALDEWGVWSRGLSSTEISQLYNGGAGIQYPFSTQSPNAGFFALRRR